MLVWSRRLFPLAVPAICAVTAMAALADTTHSPLKLDSISDGYHHYSRRLAKGANCAGGDVDCLKRVAANVYDAVTSHAGGEYDMTGTLRRVGRT